MIRGVLSFLRHLLGSLLVITSIFVGFCLLCALLSAL